MGASLADDLRFDAYRGLNIFISLGVFGVFTWRKPFFKAAGLLFGYFYCCESLKKFLKPQPDHLYVPSCLASLIILAKKVHVKINIHF